MASICAELKSNNCFVELFIEKAVLIGNSFFIMNAYTIKDLENLSGIKAHTIRIWEQRYSLLTPQRTDTNIRYYSSSELKKVLNIALLNKYGFKISHIDKMSPEIMAEKILSLSQIEAQLENLVNQLIGYMVEMETDAFESVLEKYIAVNGIEKTVLQLIFPFLERIGLLWLTNHIYPGQEHLVTNIIRQKIIVAIDALPKPEQPATKILLFLPEGEYHELGLLFASFLLKTKGKNIIYVGANAPLKDIANMIKLKRPALLYCHLTAGSAHFNLEKFLINAHQLMPDIPLLVSGILVQDYNKRIPTGVFLKKSLSEVIDFIETH